jgi:hypothetical protein
MEAGVVPSVDPVEAFTDVDVVLFVGAFPRKSLSLACISFSFDNFLCEGMEWSAKT